MKNSTAFKLYFKNKNAWRALRKPSQSLLCYTIILVEPNCSVSLKEGIPKGPSNMHGSWTEGPCFPPEVTGLNRETPEDETHIVLVVLEPIPSICSALRWVPHSWTQHIHTPTNAHSHIHIPTHLVSFPRFFPCFIKKWRWIFN